MVAAASAVAAVVCAALLVTWIVVPHGAQRRAHHHRHHHKNGSTLPTGLSAIGKLATPPEYAATSVWSAPVAPAASLDPSSSALVGRLVQMVDEEEAKHYGPWINTTAWSVPVYSVPAGQPRVPVTLDVSRPYAASLKATLAAGVPIPSDAHPARGTDQTLVVWQPSTQTLWEFWRARRLADGWHARWGGVMTHVSQNPGYFTGQDQIWGATATSLASTGGLITPKELRAGVINHALAMALPVIRARQWAWPAQRTDGQDFSADSIPEGAHFRLDPSLNLNALHLPRVTLILARAAQRYGIIVRDKAGNVALYAEDPTPTGMNPYPLLFDGEYPSKLLARFPWAHLQLLAMRLYTVRTHRAELGIQ